MQLGMVGLGRMGQNMVWRLAKAGHEVVVTDRDANVIKQTVAIEIEHGDTPPKLLTCSRPVSR